MNVRDESGRQSKGELGKWGKWGKCGEPEGVDDFVLFIKHYFATFSAGADI